MWLIEIVRHRLIEMLPSVIENALVTKYILCPQEEREKHETLKTRSGVDIKMKGIPGWLCLEYTKLNLKYQSRKSNGAWHTRINTKQMDYQRQKAPQERSSVPLTDQETPGEAQTLPKYAR